MFSYCRYQLQIVLPSVVFFVILFYLSAHTQQNIYICFLCMYYSITVTHLKYKYHHVLQCFKVQMNSHHLISLLCM